MKKLAIIVCACGLIFAGCQNKEVKTDETAAPEPQEEQMCPEMQKKKAMCEAWQQWDQQTDEMKAELIADRKAKITEQEARKAECEAKKAECEAKLAEMKAKWENFATMTIDEQKDLILERLGSCEDGDKPCCKHEGEGHECQHAE